MSEIAPSYALPSEGEIFDGKYEIGAVLGVGGMAAVLAAKHLGLDKMVALKILLPESCDEPSVVERFVQEGKTGIKIRSEHVVRMLDVGVVAGRAYLAMEHLDGMDLDRHVRAVGPLPLAVAVDFLLQACEAIGEAHTLGIIHRDLKPANLFLTHRADGSPCVKVLDFGISKIPRNKSSLATGLQPTLPSLVMGSPQYMSPEQMMSSASADQRSDIWSLGTVLYELLTAKMAFGGESTTAICARVLQGEPEPMGAVRDDLPPELGPVLARCFERTPSARYANVAELARALAPFGTDAARASSESITRILEGVGNAAPVSKARAPSSPGSAGSVGTMKPTAAEILATLPARKGRGSRAIAGMSLAALAVSAVVGYAALTGRFTSAPSHDVAAAGVPAAALAAPPPVAPLPAPIPEPEAPAAPLVIKPHHAASHPVAPVAAPVAKAKWGLKPVESAADAGSDDTIGPYDAPASTTGTP